MGNHQGLENKVLFIFLDGVGLAPPGPDNPLSYVPMPQVQALLGGPMVLNGSVGQGGMPSKLRLGLSSPDVRAVGQDSFPPYQELTFRPLDACLGVPGLPQSATGQTALFTGLNAPALVGDHVSAHPTAALREIIAAHSLLKRAAEAGARVLFANAHSERFWELIKERKLRLGSSTLTAMAAASPIPDLADLLAGRAVLWDITHEVASGHLNYDLPLVPAEEAGQRLAALTEDYDLVLFETFLPDLAGHRRMEPEYVLTRLDAFLGGALAQRRPDTTLVVCSDHGNLEDTSSKAHTTNPVPLLAVGPGARYFESATAITDVTPAILSLLRSNNDEA
jgi:hypothetical protein